MEHNNNNHKITTMKTLFNMSMIAEKYTYIYIHMYIKRIK